MQSATRLTKPDVKLSGLFSPFFSLLQSHRTVAHRIVSNGLYFDYPKPDCQHVVSARTACWANSVVFWERLHKPLIPPGMPPYKNDGMRAHWEF